MFQISPDQTQWFHLYRVPKVYPFTFVIFSCEEFAEGQDTARVLDVRVMSNAQDMMGNSWCVRSDGKKMVTRAECTKFLELRAKFMIANMLSRSVDEIELLEASHEELALAISLDESLRNCVGAAAVTLYARMARAMLNTLGVNQSHIQFEELSDWRTRNIQDLVEETPPAPEPAPVHKTLTTKTQRVPI